MKDIYQPEFFRIDKNEGHTKLDALIASTPGLFIFDEIESQLRELIKSRNPTIKIKSDEYSEYIKKHLDGRDIYKYGVWVYYPWSRRLVHMLDEEEFVDLRTSANRHKITTAERNLLATKKVGVIGLSVGQSVSVTMAMERSFGELRLADFDTLELNNLNRIRTGVHNLGLLKAVSVAREIAEIDPFLKVVLYTDGITEDNIHDFFTKGGKLDMVIDECDGVDVKILCRVKARELNVPVLMEASDRGTMDVERFDLEPDRPIMHGWLQHLRLDMKVLKGLKTSEEKLPYMLPISGMDTLSPRMKASMVEIEQTITTWPQLATAVTLGGALTADTCRRIFLGQFTESGRYFIDLEELVPDKRPKQAFIPSEPEPLLTLDEMKQLASEALEKLAPSGKLPADDKIHMLIEAAIKAPSAGNNQPWKWHKQSNCLFLFHDKNRSKSFGDFEDIASYVALGAAIENFELEAAKLNIGTRIHYLPFGNSKKLTAVVEFTDAVNKDALYRPETLVKYLDERETNRNLGPRVPIDTANFEKLKSAVASVSGAELLIKDDEKDLQELEEIIAAADRLRILHPEGHYEFYQKEVRWDAEQSKHTADGIDIATVDVTPSEVVGLKLVKDPEVVRYLAEWRGGKALEKMARKSMAATSAIGLITMPEFSSINYILGGRAVERMWLTATENNISMQPMLAATLHFARLNHGRGEGLPDFMKEEFSGLYKRFEKLFPQVSGKGEVFLFRLCIAEKPAIKSYRLPVEKVFSAV